MIEALKPLVLKHGELGTRLDSLRPVQRQEIAEAAYEHGLIPVMEALGVPIDAMERALVACGYEKCAGDCEGWFGALELDEARHCADCSMSGEFADHAAEQKRALDHEQFMQDIAALVGIELTDEWRARIEGMLAQGVTRQEIAAERLREYMEPVSQSGN